MSDQSKSLEGSEIAQDSEINPEDKSQDKSPESMDDEDLENFEEINYIGEPQESPKLEDSGILGGSEGPDGTDGSERSEEPELSEQFEEPADPESTSKSKISSEDETTDDLESDLKDESVKDEEDESVKQNIKKGYPLDVLRWELCEIKSPDQMASPEKYAQQISFLSEQLKNLEEAECQPLSLKDRISLYVDGIILLAQSQQNFTSVNTVETVIKDLIHKIQLLQSGDFKKFQETNRKDQAAYDIGTGLISTFRGFANLLNAQK